MSVSAYGMIEFRHAGSQSWWAAARVFFYGDVNVYAVLAHPWGPWEEGGDLPKPVVEATGFPSDVSLMTLHETHRMVGSPSSDEDSTVRFCTAKEAKRWQESQVPGYFLDPNEWRWAGVLSTQDLTLASRRYQDVSSSRRGSPEINGALMMMKAIEGNAPPGTETRLVLWFQ